MHDHVLQLVLPPQLEVQALLQGTLDTRDTADMLALVVWVELVPLWRHWWCRQGTLGALHTHREQGLGMALLLVQLHMWSALAERAS